MSGPEHYRIAEQQLDMASDAELGDDHERYLLAKAQVHATLALAAATALPTVGYQVEKEDLGAAWMFTAVTPSVVDVPVPGGEL